VRMSGQGDEVSSLWCERRLLARIHRYSRERRRRASRPVSPAAFMRFLVRWHGLDEPSEDLSPALSALEGWAAPLAAWEPALLQPRCRDYTPDALDQMMLSGQLSWFRPSQGAEARQQIVAATPICLVARQRAGVWQSGGGPNEEDLPEVGRNILGLLRREGAMFTADLQQRVGLLRPQMEQAMGTLVARGLVTADAFSPLRWLIRPEASRRRQIRSGRRRGGWTDSNLLGRWSAVRFKGEMSAIPGQDELAPMASALLRRYGVVFRAVLERESLVPPWRHLLRYLRRMEDRGEVHGGRFVDGFSGEQFALPEATGLLRQQAAEPAQHQLLAISACDPLNLGGIITPGVKTAALHGSRILLCNGKPLARLQGDAIEVLERVPGVESEQIERRLATVRPLRRMQPTSP